MSLNSENATDVLQKCAGMLLNFIHKYNYLINCYVLDYFVENHWEKLPASWQQVLLLLEPHDIAAFLNCKEKLSFTQVWPLSLQAFRAASFALTIPREALKSSYPVERFLHKIFGLESVNSGGIGFWKYSEYGSRFDQNMNLPEICRRHVKPKKQHEIHRLAELTDFVLQRCGIQRVMDIGSGLGHLSRLLSMHHNLKVATIEAVSSHTSLASDFDKQALISLRKCHGYVDEAYSKQRGGLDSNDAEELPRHLERYITPDSSNEFFKEVCI